MIESEILLPGERVKPSEERAPALPTEGHVATAALQAREIETSAKVLLWLLQNSPRDDESIRRLFGEAQQALSLSWEAYLRFREVFTCKGQA